MRILLILVIISFFVSCNNDDNKPLYSRQELTSPQKEQNGHIADYLKKIQISKLSTSESDTIKKVDNWRDIPSIEPNSDPSFDRKILGSYNSPYPDNFELIILGLFEGGDCGPSYYLTSVKDSVEISRAIVVKECAWEVDNSDMIAVFTSDTSFTTTLKAAGVAQDSTGYLTDQTARRILKINYVIRPNGIILAIDTLDKRWNTKEQYQHKF